MVQIRKCLTAPNIKKIKMVNETTFRKCYITGHVFPFSQLWRYQNTHPKLVVPKHKDENFYQ